MDDEQLLDIFDSYCELHPNFDSDFGDSLREYLERKSFLTLSQREALEHIIEEYRMT